MKKKALVRYFIRQVGAVEYFCPTLLFCLKRECQREGRVEPIAATALQRRLYPPTQIFVNVEILEVGIYERLHGYDHIYRCCADIGQLRLFVILVSEVAQGVC